MSYSRPSETRSVCWIKTDKSALSNLIRLLCEETRIVRLPPTRKVTSCISMITSRRLKERYVLSSQPFHMFDTHFCQGRKGRVLHIHQSFFAFLHNRDITENGGVFVTRARALASLAPKSNVFRPGTDTTKMNPELAGGASGGMVGSGNMGRGPRDRLVGANVQVIKGTYKGIIGIVKDTNGVMTRVELSTKNKVVSIERDKLKLRKCVMAVLIQDLHLTSFIVPMDRSSPSIMLVWVHHAAAPGQMVHRGPQTPMPTPPVAERRPAGVKTWVAHQILTTMVAPRRAGASQQGERRTHMQTAERRQLGTQAPARRTHTPRMAGRHLRGMPARGRPTRTPRQHGGERHQSRTHGEGALRQHDLQEDGVSQAGVLARQIIGYAHALNPPSDLSS